MSNHLPRLYTGPVPAVGELITPLPLRGRPVYPGNGYPQNPGEDRPGLSPFGRISRGQPLGKSSVLLYNADGSAAQPAAVQMLQLEGDDMDAGQLSVTLITPRVIPLPYDDVRAGDVNAQNLTGEQDNAQVTGGNFPGAVAPIAWPPLDAILEWGVRGASARAVVDYVNGMTINVVASYLRVYASVSQTQGAGGFSGTSAAYYLSAFVGPGWTKPGTAKRTLYVGNVDAAGESPVFDIPKFARRAYIVAADESATPPNLTVGYLRLWQSPDGTNNVGNYFQSGNQPVGFEIPNGAQYFSVTSGMPASCLFAVIFELAL